MPEKSTFTSQLEELRTKLPETGTARGDLPPVFNYRKAATLSADPEQRSNHVLFKPKAVEEILSALGSGRQTVIAEGKSGSGKTTTLCETAYILEKTTIPYIYFSSETLSRELGFLDDSTERIDYLKGIVTLLKDILQTKRIVLVEAMEDLFDTDGRTTQEIDLLDEIRQQIVKSDSLLVFNKYEDHRSDQEKKWQNWLEELKNRNSHEMKLDAHLEPDIAREVLLHFLFSVHGSNDNLTGLKAFIATTEGKTFFNQIVPKIATSPEAKLFVLKEINLLKAQEITEMLKNHTSDSQKIIDNWLKKLE